jgi:hypothetical protein
MCPEIAVMVFNRLDQDQLMPCESSQTMVDDGRTALATAV